MVICQLNALKDLFCSQYTNYEMRFIFPESTKWELTQYWLFLGQIRAQNPSFGLKSSLWGELVISRSSSAHILRGSLPFMFTWTDNTPMFFPFILFLSVAILCYLFCSYIPLYIILSYFQLWTLRDRRFSCLRISWNRFLSLIKILIFHFWLFAFVFWFVHFFILATPCSMQVLCSPMGMKPVWTLYSVQGKGRILATGPPEKSLIQINLSSHVIPAHTPYHPIITLPSLLLYPQHSQVFVLDSYQHVSPWNVS